ncbi:MAG: hypothetical protein CL886_00200 [Dehalococcoidia bacterium]|nr:hypothetical protein [Dehalococcoidia bacterium]HCU99184.1 hypothetical protein [Chloroflexota bacterium]
MDNNGRYTHIEDVLINLHDGQWFSWSDPYNKVYANLKLSEKMGVDGKLVDNPYSLPTEKELTDALAKQQADFDALEYSRKRASEYPSIKDVIVALAEKEEGDSAMWDDITAKRQAVKTKYKKG